MKLAARCALIAELGCLIPIGASQQNPAHASFIAPIGHHSEVSVAYLTKAILVDNHSKDIQDCATGANRVPLICSECSIFNSENVATFAREHRTKGYVGYKLPECRSIPMISQFRVNSSSNVVGRRGTEVFKADVIACKKFSFRKTGVINPEVGSQLLLSRFFRASYEFFLSRATRKQ